MRESFVRLRHFLKIFPALDRCADAIAGIQELAGEALGHGLFPALAAIPDDPADRQRRRPAGTDLDGDLVGGATDPAAAHLELRADVLDRTLQHRDRVAGRLAAD